jgi:hypothetical protein
VNQGTSVRGWGAGTKTGLAAAIGGAATGAVLMRFPAIGVAIAAALGLALGGIALLRFRRALPELFVSALMFVLMGYAFLGRSFAYLGLPPVYVGELALALGIAACLVSGSWSGVLRSPATWAIGLLGVCGAAATVPFISTYGLDALRDASLWGYGAFAIALAACLLRTRSIPDLARAYGSVLVAFAAWLPAALAITKYAGGLVPDMPGTGVALISIKPGDAGVHLAGAAAFVLLGLHRLSGRERTRATSSRRLFWPLWLLSLLFVAALNRGGFLAVVAALAIVSACEPLVVGRRIVLAVAVTVLAASILIPLTLSMSSPQQIAESSEDRAITPRQVVENVLSIFGRQSEARGNLQSTREWRLDWWTSIVDYTVFGPYFWSGKGFGVNLADDDGFQVALEDEAPLRSPHNVHMTMLARMGVPGLGLWLLVLACFATSMLRGYARMRSIGAEWWARMHLWVLAYWCAFLVNASFDVFLEGPQGGIWFWSITGLGIGVAASARRDWLYRRADRLAA